MPSTPRLPSTVETTLSCGLSEGGRDTVTPAHSLKTLERTHSLRLRLTLSWTQLNHFICPPGQPDVICSLWILLLCITDAQMACTKLTCVYVCVRTCMPIVVYSVCYCQCFCVCCPIILPSLFGHRGKVQLFPHDALKRPKATLRSLSIAKIIPAKPC